MPCFHKFAEQLNLEGLDYEPETLIVGTFNPAWPETNRAQWFYGRTDESCFWEVLPRVYGEESRVGSSVAEWKAFCKKHRIALTDLISCIDDANEQNAAHARMLGGYSDKAILHNFDDLEYTDIVRLLKSRPSIKYVYLTRGVTEAFWKHLWNPVAHYCNQHGLRERKLMSPTEEAQYHFEAYNIANASQPIARLEDYILLRWQQEWHGI
jgi:hypothetical protein